MDLLFARKVMVFGGDFRRVLPVVRRGNRGQAVDAALSRSCLWPHMRHMCLVKNMRVHRLQVKLKQTQEVTTTAASSTQFLPAQLNFSRPFSSAKIPRTNSAKYHLPVGIPCQWACRALSIYAAMTVLTFRVLSSPRANLRVARVPYMTFKLSHL
ncbi:hypothetical protein WJX82_002375 [Trebouxia sp. C0006]